MPRTGRSKLRGGSHCSMELQKKGESASPGPLATIPSPLLVCPWHCTQMDQMPLV